MSWIDKELHKRRKVEARSREVGSVIPPQRAEGHEIERITALWERFEETNRALPPELKLERRTAASGSFPPELSMLTTLLMSGNGAAIGFSGRAIRYFWPKPNAKKSNNFWIRCDPDRGFVLNRRIKPTALGSGTDEAAFDERSIDHIFECLVTGKRVTWRAVRKRRLWLF